MSENEKPLLKPEEFRPLDRAGNPVLNAQGKPCVYTLSNFPATEGREIICLYPTSAVLEAGGYETNKKVALKLMGYVAVQVNGQLIRLTTEELINNHIPDAETMMKVEWAMMEKNFSFFHDGRLSDFFGQVTQMLTEKISETWTRLSGLSSLTERPPSTN